MSGATSIYPVGAVIEGRYLVEDILGRGGFSIVYLVRDQGAEGEQKEPTTEQRFALKMLTDQDKKGRARFLFEGELLTRLDHPALPRVHRVFEDALSHQTCLLMDYIEGTNLDALRKRQPEERFTLREALAKLEPVAAALSYLHSQSPPVLHRDVKPSNLVVQVNGAGTVLVDFGIAKEYEPEATTTAIRHCSPGYGAPEQYSGMGTDQRADVYGLAATLYTLLTGVVPVDALQRTTKLASREIDPLVPVSALVPALPVQVAAVIQYAMSIGVQKRFASIEQFWQALQDAANQPPARAPRKRRLVLAGSSRRNASSHVPVVKRTDATRSMLLMLMLVLLFVGGLAFGLGAFVRGYSGGIVHSGSAQTASLDRSKPPATATGNVGGVRYPVLAQSYTGTLHDLLAGTTTRITLTRIRQTNERINGSFSEAQLLASFTGVLDASRHIFFTVSARQPLFFEGAIRSDGNLVGDYCAVDAAGQCVGNYGLWSLAPVRE